MKKLTDKQEMFCQEYLVDLNATQAAIRAGYSEKGANVQASNLLANINIQNKISELKKAHSKETGITIDRVLEGLARIAFSDVRVLFKDGALVPIPDWDDDTAAAISSVEVVTVSEGEGQVKHVAKVKTNDRLKALEKLYNHVTGTNDNPNVAINLTFEGYRDTLRRKFKTSKDD